MKKPLALPLALLALLLLVAPAVRADDDSDSDSDIVEVTITNLTRGQIMSAPVVVSHDASVSLFELGQPASEELAMLAEDAITDPLVALLGTLPGVVDVAVGGGNILPGESMTIEVAAGKRALVSFASMLVTTNDAFAAVRGLRVRGKGMAAETALAYDAGSEGNLESCEHIPGPPCDNPEVRATDSAEGYVHVHAGVHGLADLVPADHDWRNPVARIAVSPAD